MQQVIDAVVLGLIALVIDVPWLLWTQASSVKLIQGIQGSSPSVRYGPAAGVYLAIGFLISRAKSPVEAAAIGSATYAVYDLTNHATLKNFTADFAATDIIWGGALFGLTALAAQQIGAFRFRG